jgi:hypothetical protein
VTLTLADWRNLAGILLGLEAFIFMLPILIGFYFAVRGLRALRAKLVNEWLPLARTYVTQAEAISRQVSASLVEPPIRLKSAAAGVRAGVRHLVGLRAGPAGP